MGFASRVQFCGADFVNSFGRGSNLWDHRADSHLYLANRLSAAGIVSKTGGSLTLTTGLTRKSESVSLLGYRFRSQGDDSVGAGSEGDITGYDPNTLESRFDPQIQPTQEQLLDGNTTVRNVLSCIVAGVSSESSLEERWDRLHNAIKALKAVRFRNSMFQRVVNESIALQDKSACASNELSQTPVAVQGMIDEIRVTREDVEKATSEAVGYNASEVEDEVLETMIWGERAVELEREANQDVKDAQAAFQRALKSHFDYQIQNQPKGLSGMS